MITVKSAIFSVSDKTGLVDLATFLTRRGVKIYATGSTAKHLEKSNINVYPISNITNFPEILGGRVKTLHPMVFGGILSDRTNENHENDLKVHDIEKIDLVVCNLYPFTSLPSVETIDIGGPAMLRAAAKNYVSVCALCSTDFYAEAKIEIEKTGGFSEEFRRKCASAVFRLTADYDRHISRWISGKEEIKLRYGENPHQSAAFYPGLYSGFVEIQSGKGLSYNNILDADAAWNLASEFSYSKVAAIIKHGSPCGVAIADSAEQAFKIAFSCDEKSAFGGIVAFNCVVDKPCANVIKDYFLEVIIANGYTEEALLILSNKHNLRLLKANNDYSVHVKRMRSAFDGILEQDDDHILLDMENMDFVTDIKPSAEQIKDMIFSFAVCKHAKSNAIVIAKDGKLLGIGSGRTSRVDSVEMAVNQAGENAKGAVLASDAFFPFADGIERAAEAGVKSIIQPGGSVKDSEVISTANKLGISMVFTKIRHFRH